MPVAIQPTQSLALLQDEERVFYATSTEKERTPHTAVTRLIQGIYESEPEQARRIVRNRIYSTLTEPTVLCYGMMKVAAKRMTCGITLEDFLERNPFLKTYPWIDLTDWDRNFTTTEAPRNLLGPDSTEQDYLALTQIWAQLTPRNSELYLSDRTVACIAVVFHPETGKPEMIASGINTNSRNRTLHAEVNMVQTYYRKTRRLLPPHTTVYVSLKSCRMCAAMLWHCSADPKTLKVIYAKDDPGPNARNTILTAHTYDRNRFCLDFNLLKHQIEWPAMNSGEHRLIQRNALR